MLSLYFENLDLPILNLFFSELYVCMYVYNLADIIDGGLFMPEEDEDKGTPFGQEDNIFGASKTATGFFDDSDEEKESSGGSAAAISGKKSNE